MRFIPNFSDREPRVRDIVREGRIRSTMNEQRCRDGYFARQVALRPLETAVSSAAYPAAVIMSDVTAAHGIAKTP